MLPELPLRLSAVIEMGRALISAAKPKKVLFVGNGNMNGAVLQAIYNSTFRADFTVVSPSHPKARFDRVEYHQSPQTLEGKYDGVVLGIKPQIAWDVLPNYYDILSKNGFVVSLLAGTSLAKLAGFFPPETPIVRVMPNLPATVGRSVSGLICNEFTSEEVKASVEEMMNFIGKTLWVDSEDKLNKLTGISGSGPAFVFEIIRLYAEAAEDLGFSPEEAKDLALQTFVGSAVLASEDKRSLEELRDAVTSKGGTTEAGLREFEKGQHLLGELFKNTTQAAYKRATELAAAAPTKAPSPEPEKSKSLLAEIPELKR